MNKNNQQPWIGLDSYGEENASIFHGRADEIKVILNSITYNTQIVIYGPSGIGKSSIIKAGILPEVRKNNILPIYIRLNHNDENSYTEQIIKTTKEEIKLHSADIENVLQITNNCEQSLWEYFQSNHFWSKDNFPLIPLIVIDQFEEIFTLARNKKSVDSFFEELFDLVNNYIPKYVREYISRQKTFVRFPDDLNYKIIILIREDFLGKLDEYDAKYPSLRKNRYSLQAINEEQAKDIILKPGGNLVDIDVAKKIIEKITNKSAFEFDDIPEITVEPALLSLFCAELNKKRISKHEDKISLDLIKDFGDDIIKEFYERETSKVDKRTIEFLENGLLTSGGFRDSVSVDNAKEHRISEAELEILEKNRIIRIGERDGLRRIEYTHDILCKVAKDNKDNRKVNREKARNKRNTITISLLILFLVASSIFIYLIYFKNYVQYSSIIIKQHGFWKGIEDLSINEARHKTYYYKLSKQGFRGPYTLVEAFDGYGNLTTEHNIGTLLLDQWDNEDTGANPDAKEKIKNMCKWRFVKGKDKEILREDAFDKNDSLIWSANYTQKIDAGDKSFIYGRFTDDKQLPFIQREKNISNYRITFDDEGNEVLYEYYDNDGNPAENMWNAYGEEREYYENGLLKKQASLNEFGEYMTDRAGNTGQIFEYNDRGQLIKSKSFNESGEIVKVKNGYAIARFEYDNNGNQSKTLYFDENDKPCKVYNLIYGIKSTYNDNGKVIETRYLDKDGSSLIKSDITYSKIINEYDDAGNKISEEYFDESNNYYNYFGIAKESYEYDDDKLVDKKRYQYEKEKDTLKLTYHYKAWLNNKKQVLLNFWYDTKDNDTNYFEKSTFNEKGDENSFATYVYHGSYNDLILNDQDFWGKYKDKLTGVEYQNEQNISSHKWVDSIDYKDTVTIMRSFFSASDSVLKYKKIKKFKNKIIAEEYLDSVNVPQFATKYSYNLSGDICAISYLGMSGNPFRNPNYRYQAYKLYYSLDFRGKILRYAAYNEYGEKAYGIRPEINIVFHIYDIKEKKCYDLDGSEIINMDVFIKSLNYLYFFYLEPETQKDFTNLLRDGDIIVGYGNWKYSGDNIEELLAEYIRLTDSSKYVTLLRIPEDTLINIETSPKDYYFGSGLFYLTDLEHERIMNILKSQQNNH